MSHPLFRDQYIAHIVLNKRKKKMDGIYKKKNGWNMARDKVIMREKKYRIQ